MKNLSSSGDKLKIAGQGCKDLVLQHRNSRSRIFIYFFDFFVFSF